MPNIRVKKQIYAPRGKVSYQASSDEEPQESRSHQETDLVLQFRINLPIHGAVQGVMNLQLPLMATLDLVADFRLISAATHPQCQVSLLLQIAGIRLLMINMSLLIASIANLRLLVDEASLLSLL